MFNLDNPFNNSIIVYTLIILYIYITKPNIFIDNNMNLIHNNISLYVIGIPIIIYYIFTYLKYNYKKL